MQLFPSPWYCCSCRKISPPGVAQFF